MRKTQIATTLALLAVAAPAAGATAAAAADHQAAPGAAHAAGHGCGQVKVGGSRAAVRVVRGQVSCRTAIYVLRRSRPFGTGGGPSGPNGWSCWHAPDPSHPGIGCRKGRREVAARY